MVERKAKSVLGKSIIELTPIIIKKQDNFDKICYFFDTDENASPISWSLSVK